MGARALLWTCFLLFTSVATAAVYNVVELGADRTGRRGSTKAFLTAWTFACRSKQPSAVVVPAGTFLVGGVVFDGPCANSNPSFLMNGTIVAPVNYDATASSGKWITFSDITGLSISGGFIDGRGRRLWACKSAGGKSCPLGATSLTISYSRRVSVNKLTLVNSQVFHVVVHRCDGVRMEAITVSSPGNSPNTDGIHVMYSNRVTIIGANIKAGDDCISVGPGTSNLYVERVSCGPGHGISIGSLGNGESEPGVQNVTVKGVVMTGTQNGLRIKTWGKPSTGFVDNVFYQNVIMRDVRNPIVIDQNYCPGGGCPIKASGIKITNVVYTYIRGTSASQIAVKLDCSPGNPCKGIKLEAISLPYKDQPSLSFCKNAQGTASSYMNPPSCL